jgi:Tol biopolymer transport system component
VNGEEQLLLHAADNAEPPKQVGNLPPGWHFVPAWSPDGNRITSYDGVQQVIHVVTLDSGEQIDMNSNTGDALTWSADGTRLMFTNIEDTPNGSRTMVNMADFSNGEISNVVGKQDDRDYQYDALAWSPSGSRVALGLEPRADDPAQAIWLMNTDLQDGQMIANESDTSYHAPRWDPWGIALVFQQFRLNGSYAPEIALWEPGLSKPRVVAQGLSPRWLP